VGAACAVEAKRTRISTARMDETSRRTITV
jgi:hypothetical protein